MDFVILKVNGYDVIDGGNNSSRSADAIEELMAATGPILVEVVRRQQQQQPPHRPPVAAATASKLPLIETSTQTYGTLKLRSDESGNGERKSDSDVAWNISKLHRALPVDTPLNGKLEIDCLCNRSDVDKPRNCSCHSYLFDQNSNCLNPSASSSRVFKVVFQRTRSILATGIVLHDEWDADSRSVAVVVREITPGSVAHSDGRIHVGDRLLEINGITLNNSKQAELMFIRALSSDVTVLISRKITAGTISPDVDVVKPINEKDGVDANCVYENFGLLQQDVVAVGTGSENRFSMKYASSSSCSSISTSGCSMTPKSAGANAINGDHIFSTVQDFAGNVVADSSVCSRVEINAGCRSCLDDRHSNASTTPTAGHSEKSSNVTSHNRNDQSAANSTSRSVDREIEELECQLRRIQLRCRDMMDGGLRLFKTDQPDHDNASSRVDRDERPSAAELLRLMGRQNVSFNGHTSENVSATANNQHCKRSDFLRASSEVKVPSSCFSAQSRSSSSRRIVGSNRIDEEVEEDEKETLEDLDKTSIWIRKDQSHDLQASTNRNCSRLRPTSVALQQADDVLRRTGRQQTSTRSTVSVDRTFALPAGFRKREASRPPPLVSGECRQDVRETTVFNDANVTVLPHTKSQPRTSTKHAQTNTPPDNERVISPPAYDPAVNICNRKPTWSSSPPIATSETVAAAAAAVNVNGRSNGNVSGYLNAGCRNSFEMQEASPLCASSSDPLTRPTRKISTGIMCHQSTQTDPSSAQNGHKPASQPFDRSKRLLPNSVTPMTAATRPNLFERPTVRGTSDNFGAAAAAAGTKDLRELYARYADVMYTNQANLEHTIGVQQRLFSQIQRGHVAGCGSNVRDCSQPSFGGGNAPAVAAAKPWSGRWEPLTASAIQPLTNGSVKFQRSVIADEPVPAPSAAAVAAPRNRDWVVRRRPDGSRYIGRRRQSRSRRKSAEVAADQRTQRHQQQAFVDESGMTCGFAAAAAANPPVAIYTEVCRPSVDAAAGRRRARSAVRRAAAEERRTRRRVATATVVRNDDNAPTVAKTTTAATDKAEQAAVATPPLPNAITDAQRNLRDRRFQLRRRDRLRRLDGLTRTELESALACEKSIGQTALKQLLGVSLSSNNNFVTTSGKPVAEVACPTTGSVEVSAVYENLPVESSITRQSPSASGTGVLPVPDLRRPTNRRNPVLTVVTV